MSLQAAKTTETDTKSSCYHCGEPCLNEPEVFDNHTFCCSGCRLVYEILAENNLCTYYDIEKASGISPNPDLYQDKFSYLDQPGIRDKLLHFSSATQCHVNFFVPAMHCSSCIWLLEHFRRLDQGVLSSTVNFPRRTVSIVYNPAITSLSAIAARMATIGYEPHISLDEPGKKQVTKLKRLKWAKIGVAGFCFGNIMMLSLPEYFSLSGLEGMHGLKSTFSILNLLLSLPVLLFSSRDFFVSAIGALRAKHLNIDLPLAVTILMTFLRSVYELASGTGPGYFDSMSGIVFFMLIGRAFQESTFETLSFDRDYKSYFPLAVTGFKGDTEVAVQVSELKEGMRMKIRNNEVIPADSILLSETAQIDYSFVTGESRPERLSKGSLIYAGGRQRGTAIELSVVKPVAQSYLTRLWNNEAFSRDTGLQDPESGMVNRINQYFTATVFVLAAIAFVYWYTMAEPVLAWNAVTTILIVACPCILLLAATFTNGHVLRILGRNGLYLRNAKIIETIGKADTLIFDKTGTITPGQDEPPLYEGIPLSDFQQEALWVLASQSAHPLSRRIAALLSRRSGLEPEEFTEHAGKGLSALIKGQRFELGAGSASAGTDDAGMTAVYIRIDGIEIGRFIFRNQIREGLSKELSSLAQTYELYLLSGDQSGDKSWLNQWFKPERMHFRFQPEDKLNFVRSLRSHGRMTLMFGDGLNDAGALRESDAGIAVSDDVNNFSPACDGILQGSAMSRITTLMKFSSLSRRVIVWSFIASIVYNIIGLSFALRGVLQPVIAAILMPTASITIVSLATLLTWLASKRLRLS